MKKTIQELIVYSYTKYSVFEQRAKYISDRMSQIYNKNSQYGPMFDPYSKSYYHTFPLSTVLTNSSSDIACEPLRISNDINYYRVVCLYETSEYIDNSQLGVILYKIL